MDGAERNALIDRAAEYLEKGRSAAIQLQGHQNIERPIDQRLKRQPYCSVVLSRSPTGIRETSAPASANCSLTHASSSGLPLICSQTSATLAEQRAFEVK